MTPPTLTTGRAYQLAGMRAELWNNFHAWFGRPLAIAGRYLGSVSGARTWHVFEIWHEGKEMGVLIMNADDVAQLTIDEVST